MIKKIVVIHEEWAPTNIKYSSSSHLLIFYRIVTKKGDTSVDHIQRCTIYTECLANDIQKILDMIQQYNMSRYGTVHIYLRTNVSYVVDYLINLLRSWSRVVVCQHKKCRCFKPVTDMKEYTCAR